MLTSSSKSAKALTAALVLVLAAAGLVPLQASPASAQTAPSSVTVFTGQREVDLVGSFGACYGIRYNPTIEHRIPYSPWSGFTYTNRDAWFTCSGNGYQILGQLDVISRYDTNRLFRNRYRFTVSVNGPSGRVTCGSLTLGSNLAPRYVNQTFSPFWSQFKIRSGDKYAGGSGYLRSFNCGPYGTIRYYVSFAEGIGAS